VSGPGKVRQDEPQVFHRGESVVGGDCVDRERKIWLECGKSPQRCRTWGRDWLDAILTDAVGWSNSSQTLLYVRNTQGALQMPKSQEILNTITSSLWIWGPSIWVLGLFCFINSQAILVCSQV
jgi:hypothetical protein